MTAFLTGCSEAEVQILCRICAPRAEAAILVRCQRQGWDWSWCVLGDSGWSNLLELGGLDHAGARLIAFTVGQHALNVAERDGLADAFDQFERHAHWRHASSKALVCDAWPEGRDNEFHHAPFVVSVGCAASYIACQHSVAGPFPTPRPIFFTDQSRAAISIASVGVRGTAPCASFCAAGDGEARE